MKAELEKIDKQIAARVALEQQLRASMAMYQKRIEAAAGRQSDLTELSRDYQTLQSTYTGLLGKKEDSKVAANLERRQIGEQFKILDPARLPERPTSPNRPRLQSMGLAAGVGFGLALMALIEYLDKTLKSEVDVTAALNLLVLATVPILPEVGYRVGRRRKIIAVSATVLFTAAVGAAAVAGESGNSMSRLREAFEKAARRQAGSAPEESSGNGPDSGADAQRLGLRAAVPRCGGRTGFHACQVRCGRRSGAGRSS
jgi:hypothetical protein